MVSNKLAFIDEVKWAWKVKEMGAEYSKMVVLGLGKARVKWRVRTLKNGRYMDYYITKSTRKMGVKVQDKMT